MLTVSCSPRILASDQHLTIVERDPIWDFREWELWCPKILRQGARRRHGGVVVCTRSLHHLDLLYAPRTQSHIELFNDRTRTLLLHYRQRIDAGQIAGVCPRPEACSIQVVRQ
jgi:hypothetical protein